MFARRKRGEKSGGIPYEDCASMLSVERRCAPLRNAVFFQRVEGKKKKKKRKGVSALFEFYEHEDTFA